MGEHGPYIVSLRKPCEACGQSLEYVGGPDPHWRGHGDSENEPGWEPGPDPYCVREDLPDGGAPPITRVAVADLGAARRKVTEIALQPALLADNYDDLREQYETLRLADDLTEPWKLGPLLDGSVVEVEATTWSRLAAEAGCPLATEDAERIVAERPAKQRAILAAWRERHGVGAGRMRA